jgi:hypothetical protein
MIQHICQGIYIIDSISKIGKIYFIDVVTPKYTATRQLK